MRYIGNVEKDGQVRAVASGALSSGDTVVVNSDGTVSVVSESAIPQEIGSASIFEYAGTYHVAATYDINAQKVVIVYKDNGSSGYGTAVVGTVSGSAISFGSPVVMESNNSDYFAITYDANSGKVVVAYRDLNNSFYGYAKVGTVSGTSISFGSKATFQSAVLWYISATYDANSQKVVIAFTDNGNSDYGTAVVGTVSGTSISFGSATVFESASSYENSITYDSNAQKVVIAYQDTGNSSYGTAIVGTVSGTSISFGSATVFESAGIGKLTSVYDSGNQKTVILYRDSGNSNYGTGVVGTVSGTSISFGDPVVFEAASSQWFSSAYDSGAGKIVVAYKDEGNSNYGTVVVGVVSGTSISFNEPAVFESASVNYTAATYDVHSQRVVIAYQDDANSDYGTALVFTTGAANLTSENFLGFAAHTYADTQSAVINSTCTVDRNQSGLTAGQTYYVQTDGTLDTTAANPSVEAGTAISSTEIIVKG